jgi:hypothetical protein
MDKHPKRPRDPAQLAKLMIDIASGEVDDRETTVGEKKRPAKGASKSSKTSPRSPEPAKKA